MPQGLIKAGSIVGVILIAVGVLSLAYDVSPIGFMLRVTAEPNKSVLAPAILGGLALLVGILLLFISQRKS
jgi:hypothetical protein